MNNAPEWLQEFILNLNGDEIFWAPILMVGLGLFMLWIVPSIRGTAFTVLGWVLFALFGGMATVVWTHIWDWRADQYTAEITEEIADVELMGAVITADDIGADQYGIARINVDLEYEFGFSEVFAVSDIEDLVDYMVINYKLEQEEGGAESYLHTMRDFQQIHIAMDAEGATIDDVLSYQRDTLVEYANNVTLIDPDAGFFWSDSEQNADEEDVSDAIDGTGYRVVRSDLSPWYIWDERASDGGVTAGQWEVLAFAPDALEQVNEVSCAAFNGFESCEEDRAQVYHSVLLAFSLMIAVLIVAIIIDFILHRRGRRKLLDADQATPKDYEEQTVAAAPAKRPAKTAAQHHQGSGYAPRNAKRSSEQ